jgi:hypothetical protein
MRHIQPGDAACSAFAVEIKTGQVRTCHNMRAGVLSSFSRVERFQITTFPSRDPIKTADGRVLCQRLIPARLQRRSSFSSDYEVSPFVDVKDHLKIWGRFDGNAANTKIEIGGQPARALAESTAELVAEIPAKTTGVLPIQITNGALSVQKVARFVSVEVVEPTHKPSKRAANPKSATLEIRGLQRLTEPLLLEVQNHWWASQFLPKTLNPFKPRDDRWWEPRRLDPKVVNGQDPYYYEFQPKHGGIDDLKFFVFPVSAPLRVHDVVRETMAGWSSDNHIEITTEAQALIAKGFEDREGQLKETMSGVRKYNAVPNLLLAAVVRVYLFELRDLAVGGTPPTPAFGFRFQSRAEHPRTVIERLQVMQHTVADYVRTIVSRLSGEVVPLKIDSKPQSLSVLVDSKSMGQTPTEVILSPGKYTVVIKPPKGKPLCTSPKEILPGPPDELFCPEEVPHELIERP